PRALGTPSDFWLAPWKVGERVPQPKGKVIVLLDVFVAHFHGLASSGRMIFRSFRPWHAPSKLKSVSHFFDLRTFSIFLTRAFSLFCDFLDPSISMTSSGAEPGRATKASTTSSYAFVKSLFHALDRERTGVNSMRAVPKRGFSRHATSSGGLGLP